MTHDAKNQLAAAAIIVVAFDDAKGEVRSKCAVPAAWLWSPKGLKEAFTRLRAALLGQPVDHPDAWESFHIVRAQEDTGLLILASHEEELIDGE